MAQVKQVGIGRKSTGTIDGITYYTLNGKTFARSTPTMPASVYNSPEAKVRQAVFKFIQQHMKHHLRTIKQTITAKTGTPCNRYYSLNKKGLNAALQTLAEQYVDGADVTITDIEGAISDYAAAHPTSIKIASKSGYQEVYLTGPWPSTITLNALSGDSTVIIIVSENGTTTTINADGSTTVVSGSNSSSSSSNGSNDSGSNSSSSGSNGSNDTGSNSSSSGSNGSNDSGSNSGSDSGTDTGGGNGTSGTNSGGSSTDGSGQDNGGSDPDKASED